ncbi:MAG: MotA/TolQ/ExbB proton channel family protein [Burkholderiaceae bacterium]
MFSLIQAAGWPVWFLIVASLVAVALIVERFISLRRSTIMPPGLLEEVLLLIKNRQVSPELVGKLERSSPLGRILAAGLNQAGGGKPAVREAMEDAGRAVNHDLGRYLSALGTIASVAPLMGLFGTVVGMIEIFGSQAPTGLDPERLAYGISVALYNTALGILIAIPALICYRHFRARVEGYMTDMEQQAVRLGDSLARLAAERR